MFLCLFLDLWLRKRVDERVSDGLWRESSAGIERVVGFEYLTTWACCVSWAGVGVDGKRKGLDAWEFCRLGSRCIYEILGIKGKKQV